MVTGLGYHVHMWLTQRTTVVHPRNHLLNQQRGDNNGNKSAPAWERVSTSDTKLERVLEWCVRMVGLNNFTGVVEVDFAAVNTNGAQMDR